MAETRRPVFSLDVDPRYNYAFGDRGIIHATAAETGGSIGICGAVIQPLGGPHWHTHTREEETFRVISGRFRVWCGDEECEGGPGTTVVARRNVPHRWQNIGSEPASC